MKSKWRRLVVSSALVIGNIFTGSIMHSAFAQQTAETEEVSGSERDYMQWQLKQMEEVFQKQQEQIQKQQEQIHALKNRLEVFAEKPLVTKEEIQHEIEDYLATDEARQKMGLGMPPMATVYTPDEDKFSIGFKSADDKYSLGIGFRIQFQYTFNNVDDDSGDSDTSNINIRRARLCFGGNIYGKMTNYYVELDADSLNVGLRDFYVYWTPLPELNAKLGYFKVPFNQQRMTTSAKLLLQERSIASSEFDQDRDYGFDIFGKPYDGNLEYHAALFQGAGEKANANVDNELMYVFNVRYNPFGKYDTVDETDLKFTEKFKASVAGSVVVNPKFEDNKPKDTDGLLGVLELSMKYRGFTLHNEYFMRNTDPEDGGDSFDSYGFFSQAGYFVIPKKLEVAARYSMIDPNEDINNNNEQEYSVGINYYFLGHRSKIQADFSYYVTEEGDEPDENQSVVRLEYQLVF